MFHLYVCTLEFCTNLLSNAQDRTSTYLSGFVFELYVLFKDENGNILTCTTVGDSSCEYLLLTFLLPRHKLIHRVL